MKASLDDQATVALLCERIASGEGVNAICAKPDMPSKTAVYARMASDEEFRTSIARAREAQQDAVPDDCIEMADAATVEDWQVVKLRIWARQWRAAKLAPRKYGDKITNEVTGRDGAALIPEHSPTDVAKALLSVLNQGRE